MTEFVLTGMARQYLAERKAEARRIVAGGAAYTESQRRLAWSVLSGMPPHMRAPASRDERPEPPRAA